MQINFGGREATIKLVYYGPALSGKTTNLRSLHQLSTEGSRGRLMTLETKDDRTLFFDMLPFVFRTEGDGRPSSAGMTLRLKIFTVPGQVLHASTRRLVLQGADGVAFIADSQLSETEHNAASFLDLRQNLKELGVAIKDLPLVIQFNKRDLPAVRTDDELLQLATRGREPVFAASAVNGRGVLESFFGLLHLTWTRLDAEHQLAKMIGIDSGEFLGLAAKQMGTPVDVAAMLGACVGGALTKKGTPVNATTPPDMLDEVLRLEDLVDREAMDELCKSFLALFGIAVRVYSSEGMMLADASAEQEVCAYVNTTGEGRKACGSTVSAVKLRDPGDEGDVLHPCFTGAAYRIIAIRYEGRKIGRLIIGPFLPATVQEAPPTLLLVDPSIEPERARNLLLKMPRAKPETITRIASHLKAALDLILFSGHKQLLTSKMHLASVRESFRSLEDKTAKLQEAYDRLKELDRLKSNFLATVSHELRTPLTSIIGYSEMLAEGLAGELQPEQKEFVQTIHEKGEQLLALIMGLLDLSKLESGTMSMRKTAVRIDAVLNEVLSTLAPTARKKNVNLRVELATDLGEIKGDAERLRQVFINLVDNALKFTPSGGSVTMRARNSGASAAAEDGDDDAGMALLAPLRNEIEIRVLDTGIGIPERERAKVFDAFYQVDSSSTREYGGTGLGLSIVKRLVEAHGGTVSIDANTPHGTQFIVRIPTVAPAQSGVPSSGPRAAS